MFESIKYNAGILIGNSPIKLPHFFFNLIIITPWGGTLAVKL